MATKYFHRIIMERVEIRTFAFALVKYGKYWKVNKWKKIQQMTRVGDKKIYICIKRSDPKGLSAPYLLLYTCI